MPPQEPTRDGNQETFTVVEDETDEKQMSFTEAENEIEMCVRLDQSLDEVMANFFQGNSDRDLSRDKTFVELAYTSKLLEVFPSKAAVHVDGVISKHDSKEMGHWLETFDGDSVSSNSNDIFDLFQDEPFAQNLKDISKSNNSIDNDNIFQIVSAIFKEKFMASTNLPGELGIYRDITVCTHNTRLSSVFCDALQILWKCCISQDQEVDIKPEVEDVHIEHNLFARAVEEFVTNFKISGRHEAFEHGFIKKHIKSMFVPLTYRVFEEDGHHVLEVSGRKLVISALLPKIEEQFKDHPEISQIRFAAVRDICINENLTYPGICVSVLAPSVVIKGKVEWDLSGVNAAEQISLQEKAPSGKDEGEIGQDGKDGAAGGSSGNFALFTKEMLNAENFHIILNGGNGHKGQDGGDGANGADGYGEKFDEVFSSSTKVLMYFGSLSNTVTGGVVGRIAGGFERQRMNSGTINVGISSTYYLSTHFMEYYEGTEGQPGGKGGQNGCGGQGGKKGDVNFVNTSGGENFPVKVTAQDGNDGESGKPGKTGLHGKDGWDVGIMRKTMGGYLEYGKSHNEKFKIDMSKDYTDNSVYVPSLYNGSGSYCYAGIQPQKRQRKMLNDNEKYCEMKTDAERKGDAIACKSTAISMKALEEKFNAMSNTTQEQKMEVSASKETDAQLNRLAIHIDVPNEPAYTEKEQATIPCLQKEDFNIISKNLDSLWTKPAEWSVISDFYKKCKADLSTEVISKFCNKSAIAYLRHKLKIHKSSKGEFARCIRKYIQSQKGEQNREFQMLQVAHQAKLIHQLETTPNMNCSKYTEPFQGKIHGFSACIDILFDAELSKQVIKGVLDDCVKQRLSFVQFNVLRDFYNAFKVLSIQKKPLHKHQLYLENIFDALTQKYQVTEVMRELSAFVEKATDAERSKLEEISDTYKETIKTVFDLDEAKFLEKLKLPCAKVLFVFVYFYSRIYKNVALATAIRLISEASTDEKKLVEWNYSFGMEFAIQKWLYIANSEENLKPCVDEINKWGNLTAAGRSLIASETKTNLRIYCNGQLIENHNAGGVHVHHVALDPQTGDFKLLVFKMKHVELVNSRAQAGDQFCTRIEHLKSAGFEGNQLLEEVDGKFNGNAVRSPSQPSHNNSVKESGEMDKKQSNTKPSYDKFFDIGNGHDQHFKEHQKQLLYIISNTLIDKQHLELLCAEFPVAGHRFVNSLLTVFAIEGCHIDSEDLKFFIDTIFDTCILGNYRDYLFAQLFLSNTQDCWLNEFFILNCENSMQCKISRPAEIRARLNQISDDRLKILCAKKMQQDPLQEAELLDILGLLKDAKLAFPELYSIPITKWAEIVQGTHVYNLLRRKPCKLMEDDRNLSLFWCCKLAETFGPEEALQVYSLLASQIKLGTEEKPLLIKFKKFEDMKLTPSILGRLVQRLCNKEIASGSGPTSPSRVFRTILQVIVDVNPLPTYQGNFKSDEAMAVELLIPPEQSQVRKLTAILGIMEKGNEKSATFDIAASLLKSDFQEHDKDEESKESVSNDANDSHNHEKDGDKGLDTETEEESDEYYTEFNIGRGKFNYIYAEHNISDESNEETDGEYNDENSEDVAVKDNTDNDDDDESKESVSSDSNDSHNCDQDDDKGLDIETEEESDEYYTEFNIGRGKFNYIYAEQNNNNESNEETDGECDDDDEGAIAAKEEKKGCTQSKKAKKIAISHIRSSMLDDDYKMLLKVDEVIFQKRHFHLRDNQKLAVLCALKCKGSILQQIATGEGKSLIIAAISIISVLKGHTVSIVTSSSTLAKRDIESPPPKGCLDLYNAFGISAGHVCVESMDIRQQVYSSNNIVYGDLTGFQRDYLLDTFYGMNIVGSHGFDVILVDEVDSMLLDQGGNMLYLSHEIADLELLQPLFVRIWHIVCAAVNSNGEIPFDTKSMSKQVYESIFPTIQLDQFSKLLMCSDVDAANLRTKLIETNVVDIVGTLQVENQGELSTRVNAIKDVSEIIKKRLLFVIQSTLDDQRLPIPKHLHPFVKRHLNDFVDNAKAAFFLQEGEGYQIDVARLDSSTTYEPKVIIVDQGTGVDLPTTQWNNGLHQFLQLKHGCRLSAVSLKAVFVSNVSFLKKFAHLYGFSGTLGAAVERQQLCNMYGLECVAIPSSLPKLLYEEFSIVANEHSAWISNVYEALLMKLKQGRSILIICESIKQVKYLHYSMKKHAAKCLHDNEKMFKPFKEAILYCRDREAFEYGDGTKELECCRIIFSTNLAGRGTDIKLCKQLVENGGLHVVVAFLPDNVRVEEQAFGRAARCGEPGTAQLVVCNEEDITSDISRMKIHRNAEEVKRIQTVTTFYENTIKVEEECFGNFADRFKQLTEQMDETEDMDEAMKQLLSRDILDQWADWLDSQPREGQDNEVKIDNSAQFASMLNLPNNKPQQPLNRVRCGVLNVLVGHYDQADNDFDYVITNFPDFSTEAKYYKGFLVVKQNSITSAQDSAYLQAKALFEDARRGFLHRADSCQKDRSIVENYRKRDQHHRFKVDIFNQQQLETSQMMQMFVQSIEDLIGGRIDHTNFISEMVNEEAALKIFEAFSDRSIFTSPPIKMPEFCAHFNEDNVKDFAAANLSNQQQVISALTELQKSQKPIKKSTLSTLATQPTIEEFWQMLIEKSLINNVQKHVFVNSAKFDNLNPALVELLSGCKIAQSDGENDSTKSSKSSYLRFFMHSMVTAMDSSWIECHQSKIFAIIPPKLIELLTAIGAFIHTESAILNTQSSSESIVFTTFSTITESDFVAAGVPLDDVKQILDKLVKADVMCKKNDFYTLTADPNVEKAEIIQCYMPLVHHLIKVKFAYVLAYRQLRVDNDKLILPKIQLGSQNDAASWLFDLIDAGVFEHSNINFKGLNDNLQSDGLFNKLKTATGMSNKSGSNVENVLQNVKGQLSCLIRPTDSGSSKRLANSYEKIDGATAASSIEQQFKAKAGVDKFETVDAKLVALWDRMAAANLVGLRDTSLLMVHGATHIIEFMEQAYSAKTLWKIALVAGAALIQLAAGSAVMICTAGSGVFLSKFLISEGISDLIFAIKGACTGHVGSYAQHKITSMIASGIMCGAAAWMAHGSRFNSVGHGLFGSGMTTSAGVNYSALKGGALIAKAGLGNTIWEAVKQVAVQAAHAVLNLAVFTALQKALQYLIEAAIQKAREYILSFIGQATESVNHLRRTIFAVFKEFGLQRGHKLVDECGSYVLQAKSSTDDWVGKACDFIFKEYRHLFLGFCSGLQQGMSHGHSTNAVVTKALQLIPTIFMVSQLTQMSTHIISRITSIHIEINHLVETDFGAKKKALAVSTKPHPKPEECSEKDINAACDKVLQSWQKQLEKEVDAAIHQRIATPLLAMLAAKVQGQIESAIKNTYHKVMEWRDEAKIHQYKAEYEKERGAHGSNEKDAWKHYEEKLTHLMQTTRSPEVFKDIIASGAKIDMTCASAAGAIISHILHDCPVRMIVTDENGNKFTHQTAGVGEVREVEIDLRKEHYGDQQYQTGQNSCLFDAISCKVPEFGNAIHNDGQFRQALGHVLTTDPYYQLHIESGWQSIAVQQDHIGGKIHKVHYGQEDFHDAPERLDKNIAAVSKVKGGFSPHLERDDQGRTLSAEGTIRGWKQTGDGKVDGDQAKGTSAGKNVPAGMMEVDGKKVDDRGHIIPKSWGGSGLDPGNVFPQNKTINRGQAAYIDKEVAQFLKMGPEYEIKFRYDFIYGGDSHRPTSVHRQIDMYKDNKLMSTLDVNEANWDTTTPKPDSSQKEYVYRRKDNPR